ncbi:claudin-10-like [Aplochiton taeniatus]
MKIRVVQIWGFLMTVLGWIFVACTMAMEGWKISSIGGMGGSAIIKVAWYWSSLWRACFTDSTSVSNCYDFPVFWSVEGNIQAVRGLLMGALGVGMLGFVVSLMGMECTFIGGKDRSKNRKICCGGCCHVLSDLLGPPIPGATPDQGAGQSRKGRRVEEQQQKQPHSILFIEPVQE